MGAWGVLKSADFKAFSVNVKTKAPLRNLYQFRHAIWWDEAPMVIDTFLESYDFAGKTIVPFCTSASDSIDNSLHIFGELAPDAKIADGLTANNSADIEPWLDSLGYGE